MGELIIVSIIGDIVVAPLVFLVWTISSIISLKKQSQYQETELEAMQERIVRLQSTLRCLENAGRAPAETRPSEPAAVSQSYHPARADIFSSESYVVPTFTAQSAACPPGVDLADGQENSGLLSGRPDTYRGCLSSALAVDALYRAFYRDPCLF